ncbi:MAG: radical SAM protein [Thermodesulfobacteriota bacterium]
MKCVMNRGVYLRADGRLPCYCGSGETITLGTLPREIGAKDFTEEYYFNPRFSQIRSKMAEDLVPWPGVCDQCTYLDPDGAFEPNLLSSELEWFHWEPAYLCNLECEWCLGQRSGNGASGRRLLSLDLFEHVVKSLAHHGFRLKMGNICGVGEPTLNPDLWRQVKLVKDRLGGDILISTNGNGPFHEGLVTSGLTKIKIAVDAVDQAAYERYRRQGSLAKALAFTRRVAETKARLGADHPLIIWQYILFNHNDSDRELRQWQQMALDNGVNKVRLVFTRCNNYSLRTPEDVPRLFPEIELMPIGRDSRMSLFEVRRCWEAIVGLTGSDPRQAARASIKLANRIYHRLALGVKTYRQLLSLVRGLHHFRDGNALEIPSDEFKEYVAFISRVFLHLEGIYSNLGLTDQAEGYRRYRQSAGLLN